MIYLVDIDGTILNSPGNDYTQAIPIQSRIDKLNTLYDEGHEIIYWTARGARSGIEWGPYTKNQLKAFGVKFSQCRAGKPHYDVWVDDKAIDATEFFK